MYFGFLLFVSSMLTGSHSFPLSKRNRFGAEFAKVAQDSFKRLKVEAWRSWDFKSGRGPLGGRLQMAGFRQRLASAKEYPTDLNTTKLRELLMDGFDPQYMSEARPSRAWHNSGRNAFENRDAFEAFKQESGMEVFVENKIQLEDIDFWLWNLTRCNVQTFWRDLGAKFWPRYVNMGKCPEKPTCSVPKGMKCRPSETKTIKLLYWLCPAPRMRSVLAGTSCFWSSLGLEVIQHCRCSC